MTSERIQKIYNVFIQNHPVVKTALLKQQKICSRDINELLLLGYIIKIKAGYYAWKTSINELSNIELAYGLIPNAVISNESSALIHGLIADDINIIATCLTIPNKMMKPVLPDNPLITLYHCSDDLFSLGISSFNLKKNNMRIYNAERTICDLFKYSNCSDNAIAIKAAKAYFSKENRDIAKLQKYATLLRVQKYITPLTTVLK